MSILFEKTIINGMILQNRFVRSATWEGMAGGDGFVTDPLRTLMADLASGGVGLIITGHAYVAKVGQATPGQLAVDRDECIPGLASMADAVHHAGGRIVLQLAHAGQRASRKLTGELPMGPSAVDGDKDELCRAMTVDDIEKTCEAFSDAARRAREAGFDGVQIHAAHGYLLSEFLSAPFNRREDAYGYDRGGRMRMVREVYRSVRDSVGEAYPVLIKVNASDFVEGGVTIDDTIALSSLLYEDGIDAVELSGGTHRSGANIPSRVGQETAEREAYYRSEAKRFKETLPVPLILVGGIRSFDIAEGLVRDGVTDYIALSRPLVREPDLVNRWKAGNRERARCISDSLCLKKALSGAIVCVHLDE